MTQPDSLSKMEKQKPTHSSAGSCFMYWKEATFQHITPLSGLRAEPAATEREGEFTLSTFPALSRSDSDALLLLLKEGCARCITGTEESDDRKHFVRWPELTLNIPLCNLANSCFCGTKHITLCGLPTWTETSHRWVSFLNLETCQIL